MNNRNPLSLVVFIAALLAVTSAESRVADPWYLTIDPVYQLDSLTVHPGVVVEFNVASDSYTELVNLVSPPVEIDAFERIDDETFYFSVNMHDDLLSQVASPGDVFFFDIGNGTLTKVLDGRSVGLPDGVNVDAMTLAENGDLVISVDTHVNLGGTVYDDADLIRFDGSTFSMFVDGSTLGLEDTADIDAVTLFSHDRIVVSTKTGGKVGGLVYNHADVLFANTDGNIKRIELSLSKQVGTTSDLRTLSGAELPDVLFQDQFESD